MTNVWGLGNETSSTADIANINNQLNSKVNKNGDEMRGDLQMNGCRITGLPTDISLIKLNSDAASWGTCNELLINGLLGRISKDGDDMNGDLFLKIGVDDVRALGCNDLSDQTGFSLLLGTYQNQIHYERQDAAPQPIKVLSNNGILFQVNGNDIVRIGSNGDQRIVVSNDIVMNQHYITNLIDPNAPQDAATKQYVDRKARKCRVGLVPDLTANFDTGYEATASSEFNANYRAYNAFRVGNYDWSTLGIKNDFWIKIKCLEQVRVWRFSTIGRNYANEELISWRFEGSNDDLNWAALRTETNYPLGINLELVDINTTSNYQYYKLFVVQSNQAGSNPGLKHFQIYVYSE